MRLEATGLTFDLWNKLYCLQLSTFYWGDDCMARFGKIAAIGCLIPIGLVTLIPLFAWGYFKLIDIDSKWIEKEISDAFEKEEFSFDAQFEFHQEGSSSEDITSLILLGTLKQKSLFRKELPVALQTKDNGNTWKMVNNSIGADSDFRDGAESWEYFGVAVLNGKIGKVYSNVKDSVSSFGKSIILEKRSTYNKHFGDCSSELVLPRKTRTSLFADMTTSILRHTKFASYIRQKVHPRYKVHFPTNGICFVQKMGAYTIFTSRET